MYKKIKKAMLIFSIIFTFVFWINVNPTYAITPISNLSYQGIDVSNWQGHIDYRQVRESGIEVVYIKSSQGTNIKDAYFDINYENAKANGLKVGFYHFVTATNTEQAKQEARFFASVISGKTPDCKLVMDYEVFGGVSIEETNEIARAFLEETKRLTNKEQREFLQQIVLREKNLFLQISSMKNYLSKNILLKQVFAYIEETNYTYIYDLLDCLEENLVLINDQYEHVQTVVYIYAVLIRWKMDEKNDIEVWKKELSEEYPIDSLKRMLLFQNIHKSVCKQKMLMMKQIELTKIDFLKLPFFQDLQKQEFYSFLTAYKIFSIINDSDVWSDDKKIMKIMEENVVITPDIVKDNDFNENTQEYINTPFGRIYTATFGEKNVDGKNTVIEFDKQRNAKLILLSEYPNIMFENIYIDEKYEKVFKLTLKYLLYHFYT